MLSLFTLWLITAAAPPTVVVRCEVSGDPEARVFEMQQIGETGRWRLAMRSRKSGAAPVILPLPDAKPSISNRTFELDYRTLNGGREVHWKVSPAGATLDVHANFELEVNVEADLDPRVELMNTDGPIDRLSCAVAPKQP